MILEYISEEVLGTINSRSFDLDGTKCTRRGRRSTHVMIESYPALVTGKFAMKSVAKDPHRLSGSSTGVGSGSGFCLESLHC
jgi:hypothetical protein